MPMFFSKIHGNPHACAGTGAGGGTGWLGGAGTGWLGAGGGEDLMGTDQWLKSSKHGGIEWDFSGGLMGFYGIFLVV